MPVVTLPIPDDYETTTRPVSVQLAQSLLKDYSAPKNARILFPGDIGKVAQPKSTISDKRQDENNFLQTDCTVHIEASDLPLEDRILSTAVTRPKDENKFIFFDRDLGINMRPVVTPSELDLSFRFRFKDKTTASNYINQCKTRASLGRAELLHTITYHYGIPHEYVYMIMEMYRIRERVAPLNESMKDWFKRCFTNRMTVITNQAGHLNTGVIVIPENQIEVLGWYDFTYQPPKEERENDAGAYTVGFNFKVQYDKVTDVVIEYPVIIHNQILPKTIRDDKTEEVPDTITRTMQHSKDLFEFMISQQPKYMSGIEGYAVPFFDDWVVSRTPRGVNTLMSVLVEVDENDKRDLFNIEDIEELEFDPVILDFMKGEAAFISHIGKSVFYMNMYEGDTSTGMDKVTMDINLNLRTVNEMNLRLINHFHLGIISDWTMLDEAAINRLRSNPLACEYLLYAILGDYQFTMCVPMSNGWISKECMNNLIEITHKRKPITGGIYTGDKGLNPQENYGRHTSAEYQIITIKTNR